MSCHDDASTFGKIGCILSYDGSRDDIIINYTLFFLNLIVASCPLIVNSAAVHGHHHRSHITYDSNNQTDGNTDIAHREQNDELKLYISKRRIYAILSLVFVFAYQIGLCLLVQCAGISIIWCAMAAWIWMDYYHMFVHYHVSSSLPPISSSQESSLSTPLLVNNQDFIANKVFLKIKYHQMIILFMDLMTVIYYAIVMEPITTLAHILAFVILGLPLHYMTEKFATKEEVSTTNSNDSVKINADANTGMQ